MFAFQSAPVVQPSTNDDQSDVIEVVGQRPDQALKIDRRTYEVKQTSHSAQKDTLQLLRGLPAVTITPDDQINLLGASNVKILIDGHENRTNLHTLHGSDIDRIEIITNPSAQYSAEGTGGTINIVLRKTQGEGLSGNASFEGSSLVRANGNSTFKYKKSKWTYEIAPSASAGVWSRSTYHKLRSVEGMPDGPPTINTEDGGGPAQGHAAEVRMKVTYDLDTKTSVSAEGFAGASSYDSVNHASFIGITPDFDSFSQRQFNSDEATILAGVLTVDHKGSRDGETLKASSSNFGFPDLRQTTSTLLSGGGSFRSDRRNQSFYSDNKIDWQHPIGTKQILSTGAEWSLQKTHSRYHFTSSDEAEFGSDVADEFRATQSTLSAYATFQQPIGNWTAMPGLRMEHNSRHISSPALPDVDTQHTNLFPTLHLEHLIGKSLVLTLSYSKRIDRPQLDQLRPYPVQSDVLTITRGNPRLRDQSTNSYEVNLHYHHKAIEVGVIAYDRETSRLITPTYSVNDAGQNVSSWVNVGHQRDRGAEFDINMPLVRRVKMMASANLFDSRVPIDAMNSGANDERFRFTTNSTLEWDGPERDGKPGDFAQLLWHYESPSAQFQFRNFAWNELTLSYTHNFSRELSLTATADSGALHYGHRLLAPLVQEYYRVNYRPEFKLKLMKTFGTP